MKPKKKKDVKKNDRIGAVYNNIKRIEFYVHVFVAFSSRFRQAFFLLEAIRLSISFKQQ